MSQDDTGAYRCTDIEHNILVGSTDMIGLNQLSVRQRSDLSRRNDMIDKNT